MSDPTPNTPATNPALAFAQLRARTHFEASAVGLRLAMSLAHRFNLTAQLFPRSQLDADNIREGTANSLLSALQFVVEHAESQGIRRSNSQEWLSEICQMRDCSPHPLNRVLKMMPNPEQGHFLADLLLLAGLSNMHEGYATLFRHLHPQGLPYPTVALALHWLEDESYELSKYEYETPPYAEQNLALRDSLEDLLVHCEQACLGIVRLEGDGPWHGRLLRPGPGAWEALNGRDPLAAELRRVSGFVQVPGLAAWLQQADVQKAIRALQLGEPCLLALIGANDSVRQTRMRALLGAAGAAAVAQTISSTASLAQRQQQVMDTYSAALLHSAYPWLQFDDDDSDNQAPRLQGFNTQWLLPVLVSAQAERCLPQLDLPILSLRIEPLNALARRDMWQQLLPGLGSQASVLAARYPIDPEEARQITLDLALRQRIDPHTPPNSVALEDISDCLRARTLWRSRPGVQRVIPKAQWQNLYLPSASLYPLQQAVKRIHQQITVLDDWGFEQGRHDRRGLRMLFYGPPGTGKTLAAEAMAQALGVDLLVVDISSLVSKWIGETEKNLAGVFELAESSRALLLFDEADALFGKRSEVNDASDRYANLETAFLLQRLERYEGVAVLTTNLRTSLDSAFARRFEYIVEFPEPDAATRVELWRLHLPAGAPLAQDVDLQELAEWYAISGAQIRNAALAAAFLAAAEGAAVYKPAAIGQQHFLIAIEREYDKAGKAHPGFPSPSAVSSHSAASTATSVTPTAPVQSVEHSVFDAAPLNSHSLEH